MAFTDETLLYGFYSRGFKSGGFNTATSQLELVDPTLSRQFDSEKVDAFELGMKNTFADNKLRLNLAAFLYDYNGLQVSTIQRQSSVNVNIDAKVWGLEAEVYYAPTSSWQFDINASYLGSKIGDQSIIDLRDPTDGHQDVMLIRTCSTATCALRRAASTTRAPFTAIVRAPAAMVHISALSWAAW